MPASEGFACESRAMSFGDMADSYDRVRPSPAATAVDWLLPGECALAVDLGAGTGLLARALTGRAAHVIAIEPDDRMREVCAARSPGVQTVAGSAEEIPLPDGCADAVLVQTAWHWFNHVQAVPEIARVLRDGGRLGVLWTGRDRTVEWAAHLDVVHPPHTPRTADEERERCSRQHTVILPESAEFTSAQTASFGYTRTLSVGDALTWLATASEVIAAGPAEREAGLARSRAALLARADRNEKVEIPVRSWCWRADRTYRATV